MGCYSRAANLSCVIVSKSLASWRSCNCSLGSPKARQEIMGDILNFTNAQPIIQIIES